MSTDRPEQAQRPHKVVLGSYSSHAAAQHTVDVLAEHGFPVEHVTIVGTNLRPQFADEARRVLALTPVAPAERRDHPV
jgi:hypothetical protein